MNSVNNLQDYNHKDVHNSYITKFVPLDFRTSHWLQASQAFGQRLERNPQAELQMVGAKKRHRIMCHIFVHKIMPKKQVFDTQIIGYTRSSKSL